MHIDFILEKFAELKMENAIAYREQEYSFQWLSDRYSFWQEQLEKEAVPDGSVVAIEADFSPSSIALLLVLIEKNSVLVPLTKTLKDSQITEFKEIAECEYSIQLVDNERFTVEKLTYAAKHEVYQELRQRKHPGLILFSSGSTGKSKAAAHDLVPLLEKFRVPRHRMRAITFLLYDHIGGFNTLFYCLSNGGLIITVEDRSPDNVLRLVEKYKAELLPTSPTFINLILLSEAYKKYDIGSLKTITYGTETMPESTLQKMHELYPNIRLLQTYGLSEVGILRSKSKSSNSLWVKVGGEDYKTRIVDGVLQIKSNSTMLSYLNAPNPFTDDGWFNTGDRVEVDGEYIKILGRESEIINVGGQKVYPTEVENVIRQMDEVLEVVIFREKNPITGQIVCAKLRLKDGVDSQGFATNVKSFCKDKLDSFKVPVKVSFTQEELHSKRFKKVMVKS